MGSYGAYMTGLYNNLIKANNDKIIKRLTQDDMVLQHLQDFGTITTWEAIKEYGVTRLSAKIYNLKKMGYRITATVKTAKNRYGVPTHFNEYRLLKENVKNGK